MNHSIASNFNVEQANSDCLVVAVYQDKTLSSAASSIDTASKGAITGVLKLPRSGERQ